MNIDLAQKGLERAARSRWFYRWLGAVLAGLAGFLIYELHSILLPILAGAILAYLFRPVKNWFKISWLPHEIQVILAFSMAVLIVSGTILKAKEMVPDEKQKLELRVRLQYKLSERYQQVFTKSAGPVVTIIGREVTPLVREINDWLALNEADQDLFLKYRQGFKGQPPISDRYFQYFEKNLDHVESGQTGSLDVTDKGRPSDNSSLMEALSLWILTPLMFIFLIFDNGQIHVFMIGLVPNRYFEMSLTIVDELDEAIGKYLRGTSLECALVGLTMGLGLIVLGFPWSVALFVALVSGLANAIPFLGPAIGLLISLAYALIAEDTTPLLPWLNPESLPLYVAVLVGITHILDNVLYSPIVLGGAVNLHPMVVIIAITGGSILLGVWGMLLAIPTVVIFKTGLETLLKELKAYRIVS